MVCYDTFVACDLICYLTYSHVYRRPEMSLVNLFVVIFVLIARPQIRTFLILLPLPSQLFEH